MAKWECGTCGYIYDPEVGDPTRDIEPGTSFDELDYDWQCPNCFAQKNYFRLLGDEAIETD